MMKIALIHAVEIAIEPIKEAFSKRWPEAELIHLWDENLSIERAKTKEITASLFKRVERLFELAVESDIDAVMFTCSAFGEAIERLSEYATIPVLKPNQAMFEQAITQGSQVALLGTFEPAMKGMVSEYQQECAKRGQEPLLTTVCIPDARQALKAGDHQMHNTLMLNAVKQLAECDVIMLAHFSSSIAKSVLEQEAQQTILASPDCAVHYLKQILLR